MVSGMAKLAEPIHVSPFATIANRPAFDVAKVALFLLDPHPKMPNTGLPRKGGRIDCFGLQGLS